VRRIADASGSQAAQGAERLAMANGMYLAARRLIAGYLAAEHPGWNDEQIQRETSRRISHGRV
jgi:hypothetical protein